MNFRTLLGFFLGRKLQEVDLLEFLAALRRSDSSAFRMALRFRRGIPEDIRTGQRVADSTFLGEYWVVFLHDTEDGRRLRYSVKRRDCWVKEVSQIKQNAEFMRAIQYCRDEGYEEMCRIRFLVQKSRVEVMDATEEIGGMIPLANIVMQKWRQAA